MPWRIVVDSEALEIFRYPTSFPEQYLEQYPLETYTHLYVENFIDPDSLKPALDAQSVPTLIPNVEWGWTQVRAQQRQKLYESDWTCSVTDYEVPNKSDWVTYRQALRDVTRGSAPSGTEGSLAQADPFNIVWPTAPSSA